MPAITHINVNRNVWISDEKGNPDPGVEFSFEIRTGWVAKEIYIYYDLIEGTWIGDTIEYDEWKDLSEEEVSNYVESYGLKGMLYDD